MSRKLYRLIYQKMIPPGLKERAYSIFLNKASKIHSLGAIIKSRSEYTMCQIDDGAEVISYIGLSSDREIIPYMQARKENWAANEMILFRKIVSKYYNDDRIDQPRYFVDIGANIGTTFIYFKRVIDKDVKVLAFEPDSMNYKVAKINTLLNSLESDVILENYGVGEKEETKILYKHPENPGGNSIVNSPSDLKETIRVVSLDEYLEDKDIDREYISYIWVDTEGYEPYVLFGAKKLLSEYHIPLFMEFNPPVYKQFPEVFNKMVELLDDCYSKFIMVKEAETGSYVEHKIKELYDLREMDTQLGDIVFIN